MSLENAYRAEYPVTYDDGERDRRYTVAREWCGHDRPRYVARYCGEWIGQSIARGAAFMLCTGHNARRMGAEPIQEQSA
jgi:hypothetical protein